MPRPGTTTARGYGGKHQQIRAAWARRIKAGGVYCARCGGPIDPGAEWDLGHDDRDRSKYRGPEHAKCNRQAGSRQRARAAAKPRPTVTSRRW